MFVASNKARFVAGDEELLDWSKAELDQERREFIRAAAIAAYQAGRCTSWDACWTIARALWTAKPEDC